MKISFVIPAHNEEGHIAQCLESIEKEIAAIRHLRPEIGAEIIVVNNASTDKTREIASGFAGVRVIDEPNKGLVRARHAGFVASHGDIVANIDADVVLPKGWLSFVLKSFDRDERLVVLSGPFIYHDLPLFVRAQVKFFYALAYVAYALNRFVLRIGSMVQGGNFVVRRDALTAAGGFNTSIEFYGEDTDVARRLSKHGKVRWTFALPAYSSGRRLKGEGVVATSARYTINYFWITFTGKPFSNKYKDIRPIG